MRKAGEVEVEGENEEVDCHKGLKAGEVEDTVRRVEKVK